LIRLQLQARRLDEATATMRRAQDAGLPLATVRAHEAFIAALRGDDPTARAALAQVPESAIREDPTVADVVNLTRGMLNGSTPR
jgi:hypothetical protein